MPNLVPLDDEPEKEQPKPPPVQLRRSTCTRKPSQLICELHAGMGIVPTRSTTQQTSPSPPMLGSLIEEAEEVRGVWVVVNGEPSLLEDFEGPYIHIHGRDVRRRDIGASQEAKRRP